MGRPIRLLAAAGALLWPVLLGAQTPDLKAILNRLDRLESDNRAMADEIRALRAELSKARGETAEPTAAAAQGATAATSPEVPLDERVDIQGQRIEEQAQTKVEASQKFPIRLTGTMLVNAFANSRQNGGLDYPTAAQPNGSNRGGATVRQTVIGLEYFGPQTFLGGKVHGALFMDFYQGAAPLTEWIRLRTGTIQVDWGTRHVKVGVDKPIFNPRDPDSLAQVGVSPLTGTGNLWIWMPQLKFQQDWLMTSSSGVRAQIGVVQTREVSPYGPAPTSAKVEGVRPGIEGRFEAYHNFDGERKMELSVGFHTSKTHAAGFSIPSNLISADWFFNPWKPVEFSGAFFSGKNVAHLGTGLVSQGYYVSSYYGYAISSIGGWGQVTVHALPRLDFHLFTGQHDYENSALRAGSVGKNLLYGGNFYFRVAPNFLVGPEITQLRTAYLGQGVRIDNHYDLAFAYLF